MCGLIRQDALAPPASATQVNRTHPAQHRKLTDGSHCSGVTVNYCTRRSLSVALRTKGTQGSSVVLWRLYPHVYQHRHIHTCTEQTPFPSPLNGMNSNLLSQYLSHSTARRNGSGFCGSAPGRPWAVYRTAVRLGCGEWRLKRALRKYTDVKLRRGHLNG